MSYKRPEKRTVTIAASGTTSAAVHKGDYILGAIQTPAALDSTAITFQSSSAQDGTFTPVHLQDGNAVSIVVATSRTNAITGEDADAIAAAGPWIKVVCGSSESAARTLILLLQ